MIKPVSRTPEIEQRLKDEGKYLVTNSAQYIAATLVMNDAMTEVHQDFLAKSAGTSVGAAKSPRLHN
jgi:hypothetical protein